MTKRYKVTTWARCCHSLVWQFIWSAEDCTTGLLIWPAEDYSFRYSLGLTVANSWFWRFCSSPEDPRIEYKTTCRYGPLKLPGNIIEISWKSLIPFSHVVPEEGHFYRRLFYRLGKLRRKFESPKSVPDDDVSEISPGRRPPEENPRISTDNALEQVSLRWPPTSTPPPLFHKSTVLGTNK